MQRGVGARLRVCKQCARRPHPLDSPFGNRQLYFHGAQRLPDIVVQLSRDSSLLFFAGVSTRIKNRRLRWVLTIAGCFALVGALTWIATFPVSLEV